MKTPLNHKHAWIAGCTGLGIAADLLLAWLAPASGFYRQAILIAVIAGGAPFLLYDILSDLFHGELGADALAAVSIVTAVVLKQYLAGSIIVLMLSGGALLENYAVQSASSVLGALLKRTPKVAHRKTGTHLADIPVVEVQIGDLVVVYPHEIAPVDGSVVEGHGAMDESYLTGEPFLMSKAPGSNVFSGAVNGEAAITMRATRRAEDSRYAQITAVMRAAEEKRPRMRRLADRMGAVYTPLALGLAGAAWAVSGQAERFLSVLVVATPCPLIIAIPVAIIGAISLSARRGIVVKNPIALEQIELCRTAIYDKTGTLTYGEPALVEQQVVGDLSEDEALALAASLERYSKHPLARAIQAAAESRQLAAEEISEISEKPGEGLRGVVSGRRVEILGRRQLASRFPAGAAPQPVAGGGLECFVMVDGRYAARYRFRDAPRSESPSFIQHLGPRHHFERQLILSGDRLSEVQYLADEVGIKEVHAEKSPEEKLSIVREETARAKTLFIGDGVNDAPALMAATVGMAVGQHSDVTSEAAGVVILDNTLRRVDEFMHIGEHLRRIAWQSAVGGMLLSAVGMVFASLGYLPPVAGAVAQEIIDLLAIANALRAAVPPHVLADI